MEESTRAYIFFLTPRDWLHGFDVPPTIFHGAKISEHQFRLWWFEEFCAKNYLRQ